MLEPSLRVDVRQDVVPEYVIPKTGVDYKVDQYSEEWMLNIAPKVQKRLAKHWDAEHEGESRSTATPP
jgi:hypothetical protein